MKVVHVVLDHETFKGNIAAYLKGLLPHHDFIIFDKKRGGTKGYLTNPADGIEYRNIVGTKGQIQFFRELEKQYDIIVLHSVFLSMQARAYFGLFDRKLIRKIVWIEWGYDLYDSGSEGFVSGIFRSVNPWIIRLFERRIPYFIAIHPMDIDQYKRRIRGGARCFVTQYNNGNPERRAAIVEKYENYKKTTMAEKKEKGSPIVIQLGNRAHSFLHHKKWIDRLARYSEENFRVTIPLSYGNADYRKEIEDYAKRKLGDKAVIIGEVMPYDQYTAALEDTDILIMDAKRQVGLGNIYTFFRMRKKVYLPESSVMTEFFRSNRISIFDIEDIGTKPFDVITSDVDMTAAYEHVRNRSLEDSSAHWKEIFSEIERAEKEKRQISE